MRLTVYQFVIVIAGCSKQCCSDLEARSLMHFDSRRARYTFTDVLLKTVCRELFFETTRTFLQRAFVPLDVSTCTRQLCVIFQNAGLEK